MIFTMATEAHNASDGCEEVDGDLASLNRYAQVEQPGDDDDTPQTGILDSYDDSLTMSSKAETP